MEGHEEFRCRDLYRTVLITQEAAEWYVRLQDGDVPLAKRVSYIFWLKASPVHVAEMLRMRRLGSRLRRAGLIGPSNDADE